MYVANCSLKYNPEDFTVVDRVLTLANNTELVGDAFVAHHCGGLLLDGGVFAEQKVDGKYVVCLVDETPTSYIKAKCSLLVDGDAFEIVDGALSLKAVEPSGFDITWDGNTEGLESFIDQVYKVADIGSITSSNDLMGASVEVVGIDLPSPYVLSADDIATEDDKVFICSVNGGQYVIVALEAGEAYDISKGVWFFKSTTGTIYASRFYKE